MLVFTTAVQILQMNAVEGFRTTTSCWDTVSQPRRPDAGRLRCVSRPTPPGGCRVEIAFSREPQHTLDPVGERLGRVVIYVLPVLQQRSTTQLVKKPRSRPPGRTQIVCVDSDIGRVWIKRLGGVTRAKQRRSEGRNWWRQKAWMTFDLPTGTSRPWRVKKVDRLLALSGKPRE